jgi:hypothetical protein
MLSPGLGDDKFPERTAAADIFRRGQFVRAGIKQLQEYYSGRIMSSIMLL